MLTSALKNFRDKNGVSNSKLLEAFLASPGAIEHAPIGFLKLARIYEFDWGFVAESESQSSYFWEIYVRKAWETGTSLWFDRFLTAYQNLARKIVDGQYEQTKNTAGKILIVHDDGISNWSALSFAVMTGDIEKAREFFADRFLGDILPDLIIKALDRNHKFDQDWCCA